MGEEPGGMRRKHLKEIKQNTPKHTHTNTDRKTRKTEKQWREGEKRQASLRGLRNHDSYVIFIF